MIFLLHAATQTVSVFVNFMPNRIYFTFFLVEITSDTIRVQLQGLKTAYNIINRLLLLLCQDISTLFNAMLLEYFFIYGKAAIICST